MRLALLPFVAMIVTIVSVGCQTSRYRAANLPPRLGAPPTSRTNEINLAGMTSLGTNSSQIGPGDLVEITIASGNAVDVPEPMQARVSEDGNVAMPLLGEVHVAGLEPYEAGQRIAAAAIKRDVYRQPSVVLKMAERAVNRVTVLGAVKEPGVYELPRGSSDLISAVAAAGGLTEEASMQVDVLRHEQPSFLATPGNPTDGVVTASYEESTEEPVALAAEPASLARKQPLSGPDVRTERIDLAKADPQQHVSHRLGDSDVVMVRPAEKRLIHVTGLVNKPDQYEIPLNQDVRVLDAVAMAGGTNSPVADKVYVIRQLDTMSGPAVIEVSLARAKKHGNENLRLASGDLVSVEATPLTNTVDTLAKFFRVGLGLGGSLAAF